MRTSRTTRHLAVLALVIGLGAVLAPFSAEAAITVGQAAQNVGNSGAGFAYAIKVFAWVIGVGALVGGIIAFMFRHKTNVPMGVIISMIFGGFLLVTIMSFVSMGSQTVYGTDNTSNAQQLFGGN